MSRISIKPGVFLTVGDDITIQFDKFDFFDGCSHLDIYDAYDELSVMRGPEAGPAEKVIQDRMRELAQEIISGLSALDSTQSKVLLDSFVSELFMFAAKQEIRESRRQRQAEGIAAAKARGARFGPSRKPLPDNFDECHQKWRNGELRMREAAEACGMARTTFHDAVLRAEREENGGAP